MIVVDTSVWVDYLNDRDVPHVRRLDAALGVDDIVVGDLVLCEILQGLDHEQEAYEVEERMRPFKIVPMVGNEIAVAAAANFRILRRRGITVRKTIDLLIGTWCIFNRLPLLHHDSDFRPMVRHLGLVEVDI